MNYYTTRRSVFLFSLLTCCFALLTSVSIKPLHAETATSGVCVPDGTDCIDDPLGASACVGANGFLGQINIASVINLHESPLSILIQYIDSSGGVKGAAQTTLSPRIKQDFIINDMGLVPDTYGSVCLFTDAPYPGLWTGGITIYKPDTRNGITAFGDAFDFALYYPFLNPRQGPYTVPLNTFHLGTHPDALVANWISLSDAIQGDGVGLEGILNAYLGDGTQTLSLPVSISDGGRLDISGHEALTGKDNIDAVGMAQFTPTNPQTGPAQYYISLTRYFYDCPGASCTNFLTAFNIPIRPPIMIDISGGVSAVNDEISIVELNNPSNEAVSSNVRVYNDSGALTAEQVPQVPPFGTHHVIVSGTLLAPDSVGSAEVLPSANDYITAASLFYRLNAGGELLYAYAAPFVYSPGRYQISEFNSFIKHVNDFEVFNTTASLIVWDIHVLDVSGAVLCGDKAQLLGPWEGKRFTLPLPNDSYGTILLTADRTGLVGRAYVMRPDLYTLTYRGVRSPTEINTNVFGSPVSCVAPPPPPTPIPTPMPTIAPTPAPTPTVPPPPPTVTICDRCDLRGCCSRHGGVSYCPGGGPVYCADGTLTPGCRCY